MKKVAFYLTTLLLSVASTNAAIIFNPANALNVVDEGGFTGTISAGGSGYEQARLIFNFSGLSTASFQISNISLKGPGITSSLSFPSLTIAGNGESLSSLVALNTNVSSLNFATDGVTVSFNVLAGVVNDGASFEVDVSYLNNAFTQVGTSTTGPIFQAQSAAPIPEPGTWAAAALLVGGAAFMRWRRRKVA